MNIGNALAAGYSIAQTLGFLSNNFPNIGKKIKEAQRLGYDVNQIVQSFSKMNTKELEEYENSQILKGNNPWVNADKVQKNKSAYSTIKENVPKIAGLVAAPLAAYGAYRMLKPAISPMIQQGLNYLGGNQTNTPVNSPVQGQPINQPIQTTQAPSPGTPINPPPQALQSPQQLATPQIPMPQGMTPGQQIQQGVQQPLQDAMLPQGAGEIAQAAQAMPVEQQQPQSLFDQLISGVDVESLDQSKKQQLQFFRTIANQMQAQGKNLTHPEFKKLAQNIQKTLQGSPSILTEELSRGMPPEASKTKPATTDNVKKLVQNWNEAKKQNPNFSHSLSQVLQTNLGLEKDIADRIAKTYQEDYQETPPKIEPKSIVSTPQGVGEVKGISNGKALVEIDGKTHKIDEKEIEPSIFTDDDVADAYDRIMKVIPEEHRSGFIQWAGYDEDRNALGFIPRGGKYEEIMNITPEEATMIKEGKGVARTTGENREGLWVAGEDTRGGVISQIIWDRKKAKKAEEDKQMTFGFTLPKPEKKERGMKPLFDELGYARGKSQERDKAKKLAERERKKKEKDEAKRKK